MTRRNATLGAAFLLLVSAMVAACQGSDDPAAPVAERCPTARVPLCANVAQTRFVLAAVADAQARLAQSIENAAARRDLDQRLTLLSGRLGAGDVTGARAALAAARTALADSRVQLARYPADAPDLAAIDLTLDQAALALGTF